MRRSFTAQSHFRSIDSIHARFPARSAAGGNNYMSWKKTKFHQAAGNILGKIEAIEGPRLALLELCESPGSDTIDTHLQYGVLRLVYRTILVLVVKS